mmetsp:Transcript_15552/g.45980  ORF Transcript_15552/g.45980 Transcript_15552/m.45980 type:complete len:222 (-) Transcript_15552:195-860(-)
MARSAAGTVGAPVPSGQRRTTRISPSRILICLEVRARPLPTCPPLVVDARARWATWKSSSDPAPRCSLTPPTCSKHGSGGRGSALQLWPPRSRRRSPAAMQPHQKRRRKKRWWRRTTQTMRTTKAVWDMVERTKRTRRLKVRWRMKMGIWWKTTFLLQRKRADKTRKRSTTSLETQMETSAKDKPQSLDTPRPGWMKMPQKHPHPRIRLFRPSASSQMRKT